MHVAAVGIGYPDDAVEADHHQAAIVEARATEHRRDIAGIDLAPLAGAHVARREDVAAQPEDHRALVADLQRAEQRGFVRRLQLAPGLALIRRNAERALLA